MNITINKDMTIYEVMQIDSELAPIFFEFGMHCLGCPMSRGETVEQASSAHNIDLNELLSRLNEYLASK